MRINHLADDRDQVADGAARFAERRNNLRTTRLGSRTSGTIRGWPGTVGGGVGFNCGVRSAECRRCEHRAGGADVLASEANQVAAGSFGNATGAVIFAERAARRANETLPVAERIAKNADGAAV
ncbi:MAG TPA: hypothetical protein DCQ92_19045 [Verrucomicrobia subdivision 3 bacterium]|nr:hypothetical protein [Limisphaerales bacterium]